MENLQIGQASDLMQMAAKSGEAIAAMGSDELVVLADAKAGFDAMFAKVEAEIQARIDRDEPVNGFAMVNGNASKKWALSEEEMVKKLKARKVKQAEYYPQKLASPAQILALKSLTDKQKAAITKDLITDIAGKKKLSRVEYSKAEKDVNTMFCDVPVLNIEETVVQCATDVVESVPEVSFF
jgi:hypothetical protein